MSAAPLPAIEQRLTALIPRVRAQRVAHGASRLVGAALAAAGLVLGADALVPLTASARGLFLSLWVTAVGVLTWRWVLVPWRTEISLAGVARELEKQLPELGARLRAAVAPDVHAPPDAVRAAVTEDTARRIRALDLAGALPWKPIAGPVARAAVALLAVAGAAAVVPGSGERLRRVAAPWHRTGAPPYRVIVTSGEPVVRRGGPVTLSAYAERTGGASVPAEAVLVVRDGPGAPESQQLMTGAGAAFHATRSCVSDDFEYRIEVGGATSEWYRVTALDAVEPADGTRVEIAAPAYTRQPKRVLTSLTDFDGLQFGTAAFQLKFTLPAAAAHFDWRPDGAAKSELLAIDLAPDRRGATAVFPLLGSGTLRLVWVREENGKKLRTETAMAVRVAADEAPWFEEMSGVTARPLAVRPGTRVPIAFVARDDMSVSGAVLEYVRDSFDSKPVTISVPLTDAGTPRASGRIDFDPTDKARPGETVRVRIRVTDNRAVDDPKLAPQEATYPPAGWCELKLDPAAPPLDVQEIASQRDAVGEALATVSRELKELAAEAAALRTETADAPELTYDKKTRLNNACEKLSVTTSRLREAARAAALAPELRPLAAAIRAADSSLKAADGALRSAETDDSAARTGALTAAGARLTEADAKLTELLARNARLGRDRLDRAKLTALAADQSALAGAARAGGADLLAHQRELLARLSALLAESAPLGAAAEAAKGEEVRRLAAALGELAARLRALDDEARKTAAGARAALAAAIAHDQDALGKHAAALFAKLDTAARLAGFALPAPADFLRVAELAAAGKTVEALTELEKHAQALERIAAAFDRWQADRTDPKLVARQLAAWQDDLRARALTAAKAGGAKLPGAARDALCAEQTALHGAIEALALPPDEGVSALRKSAAGHAARAGERLADTGAGADEAMKLAADALTRLAADTPTVAARLEKTLHEVERLRLELDSTGNTVDQELKRFDRPDATTAAGLARKLAPHAEKLRKLVPQVAALDLPGLGARRARARAALDAAVADMRDGLLLDVPASLGWARREFERLVLVLEGKPAPDTRAAELHAKLAAVADSLDVLGPKLTRLQVEVALPVVQLVQQQLGPLVAVEAPALLNDARIAVQTAESAFRDAKLAPADVRSRIRAAATALGRLSDRLNGFESDFDRVARLAGTRRTATERAIELLTKKAPPNVAASEEAGRQLGRELDELTCTRAGVVGQMGKQRALKLYATLRAKPDPDRQAGEQKALAEALDELAPKMADVAELTEVFGRPAPPAPSGADAFLPSRVLADALRALTHQHRATHAQITNFAADLAARFATPRATFAALEQKQRALAADVLALTKRVLGDAAGAAHPTNKPAEGAADDLRKLEPFAAKEQVAAAANFLRQFAERGAGKEWEQAADELVTRQDAVLHELTDLLVGSNAVAAQQLARTEELARLAGEFASRLEGAAQSFGPDGTTGKALAGAARAVADAEKRLAEAAKKAAEGATGEAERLRSAADAVLRAAGDRVGAAAPEPPPAGTGVAPGPAVRSAERAMRDAIDALTTGDAPGAEKAMRAAAEALREAAKAVGK